ncbi:MAG: LptF/LptG family permease [Candidatus Zixiibacteriota bacterium]|nr:MAG: LptF/LptG family permease [candidate division Zixibacteria bacterium]
MITLDIYILKKFLKALAGAIFAFSVIVLVVDFVERGWRMIERYQIGFDIVALYYVNYMPFYIILAFPVAMLVSTLFSIGSLAKNRELDVMKASGLSLYRIAFPVLAASFILSLGVMFFAEFVLTKTERRKDEIKKVLIEKKEDITRAKVLRTNIKVPGEQGWIILGKKYNVETEIGEDIKVHQVVENKIRKTYVAEKITPSDSGWVLVNGVAQTHPDVDRGLPESFVTFDTLWAPFLTQTPEMMAEIPVPPRQENFFDLLRRIKEKEILGEPAHRDWVELYLKITFPFANFILVLIGIPLAANPRRSGPSVGFGLSIIISFIFFVLIRTGQSLGNNGKIPPLLAASIGDIFFILVGAVLFFKARK